MANIVFRLQIHPHLCARAEIARQSNGRVGCDRALFPHNFMNPRNREMKLFGQCPQFRQCHYRDYSLQHPAELLTKPVPAGRRQQHEF